MSLDARMLGVIESLYDAAMDESLWPEVLRQLTDFSGSQVGSFWVLDGSEVPRLPTFVAINFDPKGIEEYLNRMASIDPTVQYLVRHPNQAIVHDGLVITEREKDRHPYYDWHRRFSETRFRIVGQVRPAANVQAGVALHRTRKAGRFEPGDIEKFALLHRHLERALTIGFRLGTLGAMQQSTTELLDRNSVAIVLLDERQRIVYTNRGAEALRLIDDGVRLTANGIVAAHKPDHDRLQSLIAQVLAGIRSPGGAVGGAMRVQRPSGKRPYVILVTPVSKNYPALCTSRAAVCLLITDPEGERTLPHRCLQAAFGLTEAEARLAALLAAGKELRCAAEKLGITYGTARVRLAEIFQKTETCRQGELIKLLVTTVAMG